jgi:alanine racemase
VLSVPPWFNRALRQQFASKAALDVDDVDVAIGAGGDVLEVVGVGGEDQVAVVRQEDPGCTDGVARARSREEHARASPQGLVERLDATGGEQPRDACLSPGATAPDLGHDAAVRDGRGLVDERSAGHARWARGIFAKPSAFGYCHAMAQIFAKDPPASSGVEVDDDRVRVLRPRRAAPSEAARVTRAEVNLAHVRHNLRELRACLEADATAAARPPAQIWAVLKADGYGHGASAIATTLEQAGVDGLCVALLEEAIELRQAGVRSPVLVMGGYYGRYRDGLEALVEHDLTPVVYDENQIERIAAAARYVRLDRPDARRAPRLGVHLEIDTGMGRLGVRESDLEGMIAAIKNRPEVRLDALMTHMACAEDPDSQATDAQLAIFARATATVGRGRLRPAAKPGASVPHLLRHAANSAAALRLPEAQLDIVRPGIAIYGVHPASRAPSGGARVPKLRPAMRVVSEVVALRDLPAGERIGYGHTWQAKRPSRIATLAMGYGDGLDRGLSNLGEVLVCGRRVPIVGTVSMDLTMIDVTDVPGVSVRDEVVLLGRQRGRLGDDQITAEEIAEKTGRIPWECLTAISRRVPRFYRHP